MYRKSRLAIIYLQHKKRHRSNISSINAQVKKKEDQYFIRATPKEENDIKLYEKLIQAKSEDQPREKPEPKQVRITPCDDTYFRPVKTNIIQFSPTGKP